MGDSPSPYADIAGLAEAVAKAKAEAEAKADEPVTIADVAAAAFVALETLVALMPTDEAKQRVINEFEQRAAHYAAGMEEE